MRKVLKHLKDYDTIKTDHFANPLRPEDRRGAAHYMADYLEQIYTDLFGEVPVPGEGTDPGRGVSTTTRCSAAG